MKKTKDYKYKKKQIAIDNEIFDESVKIPSDEELLAKPLSEDAIIEYLEDKYSIKQNPDIETYNNITDRVKKNAGYCPCKIQKNNDTRCICKEFKLQDEEGLCHCKRYIKVLNDLNSFKKRRIASVKRIKH